MKSRGRSFNIYFTLVFCLVMASGCAEIKSALGPKKPESTIRLYMEGERADKTSTGTVMVTRNHYLYTIQREPFLDEGDLNKATIVDDPDGSFAIQLIFNDHGMMMLDMMTADNLGKHIIVFSQFPKPGKKQPKPKKKPDEDDDADLVEPSNFTPPPPEATGTNSTRDSAWLAAVLIRHRITDGIFRFTPDASRAEGLRIVRGLRNVIQEAKKKEQY
jgi:hypothetical protein